MRAREILRQDKRTPSVLMQFSGKQEGWIGGIDEAIAILKLCADDWNALTVNALYEGDHFNNWDTVLTIEGPYEGFAHLETLCVGLLSRRTKICTNAKLICQAAQSKPVMFFGARDDVLWTQAGDGYSAMAGGVKMVSTEAQASLFGGKAVGTIPHALIAAFGGDTVKATKRFAETIEGVDVIALVD
jgi:nicotinate phosphoribosyltransferase